MVALLESTLSYTQTKTAQHCGTHYTNKSFAKKSTLQRQKAP